MKKTDKEKLYDMWGRVCDGYVAELAHMWGFEYKVSDWVGDDFGGVACINEEIYVNMDDVRYCVDNEICYDEYNEWSAYIEDVSEFSLPKMNLRSWHMGCPRVPKEVIDRLKQLKQSLNDSIDSINKEYGNEKQNS